MMTILSIDTAIPPSDFAGAADTPTVRQPVVGQVALGQPALVRESDAHAVLAKSLADNAALQHALESVIADIATIPRASDGLTTPPSPDSERPVMSSSEPRASLGAATPSSPNVVVSEGPVPTPKAVAEGPVPTPKAVAEGPVPMPKALDDMGRRGAEGPVPMPKASNDLGMRAHRGDVDVATPKAGASPDVATPVGTAPKDVEMPGVPIQRGDEGVATTSPAADSVAHLVTPVPEAGASDVLATPSSPDSERPVMSSPETRASLGAATPSSPNVVASEGPVPVPEVKGPVPVPGVSAAGSVPVSEGPVPVPKASNDLGMRAQRGDVDVATPKAGASPDVATPKADASPDVATPVGTAPKDVEMPGVPIQRGDEGVATTSPAADSVAHLVTPVPEAGASDVLATPSSPDSERPVMSSPETRASLGAATPSSPNVVATEGPVPMPKDSNDLGMRAHRGDVDVATPKVGASPDVATPVGTAPKDVEMPGVLIQGGDEVVATTSSAVDSVAHVVTPVPEAGASDVLATPSSPDSERPVMSSPETRASLGAATPSSPNVVVSEGPVPVPEVKGSVPVSEVKGSVPVPEVSAAGSVPVSEGPVPMPKASNDLGMRAQRGDVDVATPKVGASPDVATPKADASPDVATPVGTAPKDVEMPGVPIQRGDEGVATTSPAADSVAHLVTPVPEAGASDVLATPSSPDSERPVMSSPETRASLGAATPSSPNVVVSEGPVPTPKVKGSVPVSEGSVPVSEVSAAGSVPVPEGTVPMPKAVDLGMRAQRGDVDVATPKAGASLDVATPGVGASSDVATPKDFGVRSAFGLQEEAERADAERLVAAGVVPAPVQPAGAGVGSVVIDAVPLVSSVDITRQMAAAVPVQPAEVLVQAAQAVAETMLVSPGLLRGQGEVRIQLKPEVLGGSEIQIAVSGRDLQVAFVPQTPEMAALIEKCLPQLEQHLAGRIHSFQIAVEVRRRESGKERT